MPIASRLLKIAEDALSLGVVLLSDAIDSWSSGESRGEILQRLRDNAQRGAELALENERLRDEVDSLRFNGPTLYRDEVEALYFARGAVHGLIDYKKYEASLERLLNRCDHMPMTSAELSQQIDDITSGRAKLYTWEEVFGKEDPSDAGRDVDEDDPYEGSWREAADNEGARIARGSDE